MDAEIPLPEGIHDLVDSIIREFNPEKIILFGSHATKTTDDDSDVDLLVVLPFTDSRVDMTQKLREATSEFTFAKDLIPVRPKEYQKYKDYPGTIIRPAHLEGTTLYERAA